MHRNLLKLTEIIKLSTLLSTYSKVHPWVWKIRHCWMEDSLIFFHSKRSIATCCQIFICFYLDSKCRIGRNVRYNWIRSKGISSRNEKQTISRRRWCSSWGHKIRLLWAIQPSSTSIDRSPKLFHVRLATQNHRLCYQHQTYRSEDKIRLINVSNWEKSWIQGKVQCTRPISLSSTLCKTPRCSRSSSQKGTRRNWICTNQLNKLDLEPWSEVWLGERGDLHLKLDVNGWQRRVSWFIRPLLYSVGFVLSLSSFQFKTVFV